MIVCVTVITKSHEYGKNVVIYVYDDESTKKTEIK